MGVNWMILIEDSVDGMTSAVFIEETEEIERVKDRFVLRTDKVIKYVFDMHKDIEEQLRDYSSIG